MHPPTQHRITIGQAADRIARARGHSITRQGVTAWMRRYPGLGRKIGGRWSVCPDTLARILEGEAPRADAVQ